MLGVLGLRLLVLQHRTMLCLGLLVGYCHWQWAQTRLFSPMESTYNGKTNQMSDIEMRESSRPCVMSQIKRYPGTA